MVDEGDRTRRGDSGGEERPKEQERQAGGSEWLLQQLSGGRLKSIFEAPRQAAPEPAQTTPAPARDSEEEPTGTPDEAALPEGPGTAEQEREDAAEPAERAESSPADDAEKPPAERTAQVPPLVAAEASAPPEPVVVLEPTAPLQSAQQAGPAEEVRETAPEQDPELHSEIHPVAEPDRSVEPESAPEPAPAPEQQNLPEPEARDEPEHRPQAELEAESEPEHAPEPEPERSQAPEPERSPEPEQVQQPESAPAPAPAPVPPVAPERERPQPRFDAARRDPAEERASAPRPVLPVAEPPRDLPTAPPALRVEPEPREPRGDRPEGATPPSQRDTAPSGTVYHWPDPRGGWDEPPVWEDVVAPQEDPDDDDGGDEELWRGTAFAWNLEPTEPGAEASGDGADAGEASDPDAPPTPTTAGTADDGKPFSTTPAAAHVNAPAARERTPRSRPAKEPREKTPRTPREKTPRAPREKTPRAPRGKTAPPAGTAPRSDRAASVGSATEPPSITALAAPSPDRTRSRRRLLIGLIALGVVVVLAALAVVGYRIAAGNDSEASAPAPVATTPSEEASAAPTAEPTAELPTVGPLPAGTYAWSDLLGGECLQPFDSVWAEEFTVVDCATAHTGEMVATAQLTEEAFPGQDALALSVASLCQATGVVDVLGAEAYGDVQVSASFPVTQEQWDAGERRYFCFVDRAGGGELIGALTGTPAG